MILFLRFLQISQLYPIFKTTKTEFLFDTFITNTRHLPFDIFEWQILQYKLHLQATTKCIMKAWNMEPSKIPFHSMFFSTSGVMVLRSMLAQFVGFDPKSQYSLDSVFRKKVSKRSIVERERYNYFSLFGDEWIASRTERVEKERIFRVWYNADEW